VNIYKNTKKLILKSLYANFKNLNEDLESKVTCEQPKNSKFGDISSNVILVASKTLNLDKRKIYEVIIQSLLKNEFFIKTEFINPGFLNLYFSNDYWLDFLKKINLEGDNFGFRNIGKNKKINVEFVSAILQVLYILGI
jgi:arginyl-tRNA synthetase